MHISIYSYEYKGFILVGSDFSGYAVNAGPIRVAQFPTLAQAIQYCDRTSRAA